MVTIKLCRCGCGRAVKPGNIIIHGHSKANTRHGLAGSAEYRAYYGAHARCTLLCANKDPEHYDAYLGKGIKFLYRNFEEFLRDIGPRPSSAHSLDRIESTGNYEPGNCKWSTRREQGLNRKKPIRWGMERHQEQVGC